MDSKVTAWRVLVVDDHEPWRRHISSVLQSSRRWQVVGEAADGVQAIQEANALRPDLILLDIDLPALSGIEAARRILARDADSKILFVSAHRSWDIVGAAMGTGARGYVQKSTAAHELLPAMEVVVEGARFVSEVLTGRSIETRTERRDQLWPRHHEAGFYSDDAFLLDAYASFAEASLNAGKSLIVSVVDSRLHDLRQELQARGVNVDRAIRERRYLAFDVADGLSGFMVDGWLDEARFWRGTTAGIAEAAAASREPHHRVAVLGEGSAYLVRQGRADAAVRLEHLWDEFARTCNVESFCGFRTDVVREDDLFHRICQEHSAVHSR